MMEAKFVKIGKCKHPKGVVLPGSGMRSIDFPSVVTLIEHPKEGLILFDAGYSKHNHTVTRSFPERLYALTVPFELKEEETLENQLKNMNYTLNDVKHVIVSHFHGDHIGGLKDCKKANFIYLKKDLDFFNQLTRFRQVTKGFLRGLIPEDIEMRSTTLETLSQKIIQLPFPSFNSGWDLFGDGSIVAVGLPGHTPGQIGIFLNYDSDHPIFLVSDACWLKESYENKIYPSFITGIVHHDFDQYKASLDKIHNVHKSHPNLQIVPCHCQDTFDRIAGLLQ